MSNSTLFHLTVKRNVKNSKDCQKKATQKKECVKSETDADLIPQELENAKGN